MTYFIRTLFAQFALWHHRARTRRQLQDLPSYMLADIGLEAAARDEECAKWGWQGQAFGPVVSLEQTYAKENGRCLRAPVSNFTAFAE